MILNRLNRQMNSSQKENFVRKQTRGFEREKKFCTKKTEVFFLTKLYWSRELDDDRPNDRSNASIIFKIRAKAKVDVTIKGLMEGATKT